MQFYQTLPSPPKKISNGAIIARLIDGLGFRFFTATDNLTENEFDFRPVEGSMNMTELLKHMYHVLKWGQLAFDSKAIKRDDLNSFEDYRNEILKSCENFRNRVLEMSDEEISKVSIYRKRNDTHYSFWYIINGPIADVLTHVGQIASWRRMAGNPIEKVSPFNGER